VSVGQPSVAAATQAQRPNAYVRLSSLTLAVECLPGKADVHNPFLGLTSECLFWPTFPNCQTTFNLSNTVTSSGRSGRGHMKLRILLRVAFTAACVVLCLLELALRTRSYTLDDVIKGRILGCDLELESRNGQQKFDALAFPPSGPQSSSSGPIFHLRTGSADLGSSGPPGWYFNIQRTPIFAFQIAAPHWGLATLMATLAALPWIRLSKRFSLRTLLIAVTLVAITLGFVVYARTNQDRRNGGQKSSGHTYTNMLS
jgi:hypothetical protein